MHKGYNYPDMGDRITTAAFKQAETSPGIWNESAERGLRRLSEKLETLLPPRHLVNGLDAGCGQGRLIPWVARFAAKVTAIDADCQRLGEARKQISIGDTALQFDCRSITSIEDGPYDLIVCSHVVQHVPIAMARNILQNLARVASPGALMVLAFSRSAVGAESFGLSSLDEGAACIDVIDGKRFDEIAGRHDHTGSIPFRRIDPESFAVEASNVGWHLLWKWTYHIFDDVGGFCNEEEENIINSSPNLERNSIGDIYTLWRYDDHAGI